MLFHNNDIGKEYVFIISTQNMVDNYNFLKNDPDKIIIVQYYNNSLSWRIRI